MIQVFKLTFPNRKIFIGKDEKGFLTYFGGFNQEEVESDYRNIVMPSFTIKKEILWESENAEEAEIDAVVESYIRMFRSDDPRFGYNSRSKVAI
ncbi:MAG: hypothetical protein FD137_1466 [Spirochaetes bacterium]|nr:MAG: hypothetical protein FD137_1466 [Spirochaetota bacterium]